MNTLQIIDKVEAHLRTMAQRAHANGRCWFRTPTGERCAVGCLIPDDKYDPEWDTTHPDTDNAIIEMLNAEGIKIDRDLYCNLQNIHDRPGNWGPTGFIGDFTALRKHARTT